MSWSTWRTDMSQEHKKWRFSLWINPLVCELPFEVCHFGRLWSRLQPVRTGGAGVEHNQTLSEIFCINQSVRINFHKPILKITSIVAEYNIHINPTLEHLDAKVCERCAWWYMYPLWNQFPLPLMSTCPPDSNRAAASFQRSHVIVPSPPSRSRPLSKVYYFTNLPLYSNRSQRTKPAPQGNIRKGDTRQTRSEQMRHVWMN